MLVPCDKLSASSFDESNAFTCVLTPQWCWGWCSTPPVQARHVWSVLPEELRKRVDESTWVYPQYCRLPMGGSHSVNILMNINITRVGRACCLC